MNWTSTNATTVSTPAPTTLWLPILSVGENYTASQTPVPSPQQDLQTLASWASREGNASTTHIPFWSGAGVSRYFRDEHQAAHAATYIDYLNKTKNPVLYLIDDNSKYRATPDLVAWGADFEEVYQGISYNTTGGASLSTPIVASMLALINSERRKQGRGTIGWVHPVVYSNRAKASAFVDVDHGGVFGCSDDPKIEFPALTGFDFASGLGRPDFPGLAALFLWSNVVTM